LLRVSAKNCPRCKKGEKQLRTGARIFEAGGPYFKSSDQEKKTTTMLGGKRLDHPKEKKSWEEDEEHEIFMQQFS